MTFAIPGILAEQILNAVHAGTSLTVSKLGIHVISVKDVADPAKEAGIPKHDILLAIEDTEILDAAQLKNYLIERTTPEQKEAIKIRRVDADRMFHIVLSGE